MPLHVRWLGSGPLPGRARARSAGLFAESRRRPPAAARAPARVHARRARRPRPPAARRRPRWAPSWCAPTAAATSPTTGPGQLVGYPILTVPGRRGGGLADTAAYVRSVEQLVIDVARRPRPGRRGPRCRATPACGSTPDGAVPRKICAVGVRLSRGRSMHGFALNVDPDLSMFGHIVPCGIADKGVTSLAAEGIDVSMREVVDARRRHGGRALGAGAAPTGPTSCGATPPTTSPRSAAASGPGTHVPRANVDGSVPRGDGSAGAAAGGGGGHRGARDQRPQAGVDAGAAASSRRRSARVRRTMRDLGLVTVCEEAGCPNLSECWADGTATFMINGERCTRACGFCLVDTRHPEPPDPAEPARVAEAVERMGLRFAVVTAVARDDLADGGAAEFAATIRAIRARTPGVSVEVLIPDCKGDPDSLDVDLRRAARRAEPQPRDRGPAAAGRAPVGRLRPLAVGPGPGQGRRAHHEVVAGRRVRRDRRRGASRRSPTCGASASTSSRSASTCAPPRTTSRWPAGGPRTSSPR